MKHNLHLLLGGVSDFKGQKLQLQCHCFSTAMICTNNELVSTTFEQKVRSDWDLVGLVPVVTWWQTPALWVQPSSLVLAARPFHPSLQSGRGSFWSGSGVGWFSGGDSGLFLGYLLLCHLVTIRKLFRVQPSGPSRVPSTQNLVWFYSDDSFTETWI